MNSLKEDVINDPEVLELLDEALKEIDKLLILPTSDLRMSDVKEIFGLSLDKQSPEIWRLDKKDIIPVPQFVCKL